MSTTNSRLNSLIFVCLLVGCCVTLTLAASIAEDGKDGSPADELGPVEVSSTTPAPAAMASRKKSENGSSVASDRLMKELQKMYKSDSLKKGLYSVELVDDSLYEWRVKLFASVFDKDTLLHKDLVELGKSRGKDYVELSIVFGDDYPFCPPSVRVVYPALSDFNMYAGGHICMDLFTPQGWSSAYKMEGALIQTALRLTQNRMRVRESDPAKVAQIYRAEDAKKGHDELLEAWAMKDEGKALKSAHSRPNRSK